MAEIVLDGTGVLAIVREFVAAGMAQHVAVNQERETSSFAGPRDHALIASHRKRCETFGHEHIDALGRLTLKTAQGAQLFPADWMNARRAAFGTSYVQFAGREVDIVPAQGDQLRSPQTVPIGYQEGRSVPMPPPVVTGSVDQLFDL